MTTMKVIKRILTVIEGLVFMALSFCLQSFFFLFLTMAVFAGLQGLGLESKSNLLYWTIFALLLTCFNAIACWEYFKKGRAQVGLGKTSSAIFMIPRAFDLIWNGSERITR